MSYILFSGVLILFFLSFFLFKKNILNPSVIVCSVFLISLFFSILNEKEWKINFHLNTILLIFSTLIIFILGNSTVCLLFKKRYKRIKKNKIISNKIISFKVVLLIDIILFIVLYKYFDETYKLSLIGGNPGGYNLMLFYARNAKLNFHSINRLTVYSSIFVKAISYIYYFIFSYFSIFKKFKIKNLFLLSPLLIYCGFIILSTGRAEFIYLLIYMLTIFFVLYQQKYNFSFKVTKKIIVFGILSLIVFFIIFSLAGLLTGKTQSKSVFEMISIYTGSSLPALDIYINSPKIPNKYFGEHTLFTVHKILRIFGNTQIPQLTSTYDFVYFGDIKTNIYTPIRRYFEDFGLFGLYLITFIFGKFYGIFFYCASYKKNNFFILILYATFSYPLFMFSIDDVFFKGLFPMELIYDFIALGTIYYFFVYKNIRSIPV